MLQLVMGTDWVAVRNEILNRIAGDVQEKKGKRIYMVPELISHDTERRLCLAAGDTASRYAEVLSFTRLARRVEEYTGSGTLECLDNGGRVIAMAAAARQLAGQLKAYASVETRPEFLTGLVDVMDEFKRCCISSQDLHEAALQTEGSFSQKLEELSLLLGAYDSICSRGKRDPRDRETVLLEQLENSDFAAEHVFYIDGFPDYTRQHMAILEHLLACSASVTVGINSDRVDSKAMAFEKAGATAGDLIRMAKRLGVDVKITTLAGRTDELGSVCRGLFQGETVSVDSGLSVLNAKTLQEEVLTAAELVMDKVAAGCRYRDIGIVVGDMGVYAPVLELTFHRCGIPIYCSGKEDILQKTVIATTVSAMEAALGGFEQKDVLRYLKSILSPVDADTCDKLENYVITWGIRGKKWFDPWINHPDGLNGFPSEASEALLAQLNEAREQALAPLLCLYNGFASAANLGEQVTALYTFMEQIALADRLDALARQMDEGGDNRGAQILDQLWEILVSALEQMYDVLGNTHWETAHFTKLFTLLLSQYDVGTIPTVLDAVTVGPVSAMRCNEVKHLIVLGVAEGMLPGYGGAGGLLTDQERVALRDLGVPLTGGAMEGIQAEFAEIYGVFCGARESISALCGGAQPSYVYRRLAQMAAEETTGECLGAALRDRAEAAAYLASLGDYESAMSLGLQQEYYETRQKADFEMGSISRENVPKLYGQTLNLSASQVDRQAECRMSYFLRYGLRAQERKEAEVDPAEFGTYVHAVLEQTARRVMELGGFTEVSLERTMELALGYSEAYAQERFKDIDSQRITYLFRRNIRELEMVVAELWHELKASRFTPEDFELKFGAGGRMAAINIPGGSMPAALRGFVDRVDIWNEDGRNYFRVVDYKTGKKDFDYCDVFNGVGLQMLLYLFALEENDFGTGAGVQYFPARAPLMSADGRLTEEEAEAQRRKEWKRKGLLLRDEDVLDAMDPDGWQRLCATKKKDGSVTGDLADRQQLKLLKQYVFYWLGDMVSEIAAGNVQANPYTRGTSHDACAFCPYGSICHKDESAHRRNYKTMEPQRFWEEVEKEVNRRG